MSVLNLIRRLTKEHLKKSGGHGEGSTCAWCVPYPGQPCKSDCPYQEAMALLTSAKPDVNAWPRAFRNWIDGWYKNPCGQMLIERRNAYKKAFRAGWRAACRMGIFSIKKAPLPVEISRIERLHNAALTRLGIENTTQAGKDADSDRATLLDALRAEQFMHALTAAERDRHFDERCEAQSQLAALRQENTRLRDLLDEVGPSSDPAIQAEVEILRKSMPSNLLFVPESCIETLYFHFCGGHQNATWTYPTAQIIEQFHRWLGFMMP